MHGKIDWNEKSIETMKQYVTDQILNKRNSKMSTSETKLWISPIMYIYCIYIYKQFINIHTCVQPNNGDLRYHKSGT